MTMNLTPQRILSMLLRHVKLIILITLLVTLLTYGYTSFFVAPTYSASALVMVQNYDADDDTVVSSTTGKVSSSDISTSATMASNCVVLFQNSPDMTSLMTCSASISLVDENNNFIKISAYSTNPTEAAKVANELANQSEKCFQSVFEYGKLSIIREASVPSSPYAPNVSKNTMYGFVIGIVLGILIAFFIEIIDTTIKPGDDLEKIYNIPVFAEVVDFEQEG